MRKNPPEPASTDATRPTDEDRIRAYLETHGAATFHGAGANPGESLAPASAPPGERLLRLPQVLAMTGRGRTSTLDDVKAGTFPRPIKCGAASLFLYSEVQAWIAARVRESRGVQ